MITVNDLHGIIDDSYHDEITPENRVLLQEFYNQWLPISHLCLPHGVGKNKLIGSVHKEINNGLSLSVDNYIKLSSITFELRFLGVGIDANIPLAYHHKLIYDAHIKLDMNDDMLDGCIDLLRLLCVNTELCEEVIQVIYRYVNRQKLLGNNQ